MPSPWWFVAYGGAMAIVVVWALWLDRRIPDEEVVTVELDPAMLRTALDIQALEEVSRG